MTYSLAESGKTTYITSNENYIYKQIKQVIRIRFFYLAPFSFQLLLGCPTQLFVFTLALPTAGLRLPSIDVICPTAMGSFNWISIVLPFLFIQHL